MRSSPFTGSLAAGEILAILRAAGPDGLTLREVSAELGVPDASSRLEGMRARGRVGRRKGTMIDARGQEHRVWRYYAMVD